MKASWQKQVIASNGYRELGMFDDAANALEEIEPEDKTRNEVLYARVTTVRYAPSDMNKLGQPRRRSAGLCWLQEPCNVSAYTFSHLFPAAGCILDC